MKIRFIVRTYNSSLTQCTQWPITSMRLQMACNNHNSFSSQIWTEVYWNVLLLSSCWFYSGFILTSFDKFSLVFLQQVVWDSFSPEVPGEEDCDDHDHQDDGPWRHPLTSDLSLSLCRHCMDHGGCKTSDVVKFSSSLIRILSPA